MPKRRRLTYRKYGGTQSAVKGPMLSRIWLQDEYVAYIPTLLNVATEFKNRIVQERLSELTPSQVSKLYLDSAWSVLLNKYDVDISFKNMQKRKPSNRVSELKYFFLDNNARILTTITNKIAALLDETELENSMEDLLLNHVWFNCNRQYKNKLFSASTLFGRLFEDTELKSLSLEEMLQLCAHSIWNALMYQAMSNVLKDKIQEQIKHTEEVVETDGQYEVDSKEMIELGDVQITSVKEETLDDIKPDLNDDQYRMESKEMIELEDEQITSGKEETLLGIKLDLDEATTIPQVQPEQSSLPKCPSKFFIRQKLNPTPVVREGEPNQEEAKPELCVKIPFPSGLTPSTDVMILLKKAIFKVQKLSKSEIELSLRPPKKYGNRIIKYEIFMLQGLKFNLDLSCWSKFNLNRTKEIPTTYVIKGLNSGRRYYFTVRGITDDEKITALSDVQFIIL